jgi:predicted O-methyltransferase YrrM
MSCGHLSYVVPLWHLARGGFIPKRMIELGCGCSSYVIRSMWPKSEMIVIDDHEKWMEVLYHMGFFKVDKIFFEKSRKGFITQIKENGPYDLVFVDSGHLYNNSGPWRTDFMKVIRRNDLLNEGGVIILHDANRPEYQDECNKWPQCLKLKKYNTYIVSNNNIPYEIQ